MNDRVIARWALVVLAAVAVALQPISTVLAKATLANLDDGTDTWSIWSNYAASEAPDVLFVGDSRVRQDVDPDAIARAMSIGSRHTVSVAKIGLSNADAMLIDAAMYRVVSRPDKPRTIVIAVSEFAFNANYQPDRTDDYWQLSGPPDLGFMQVALDHDWNRSRLLEGWAVPLVAQWPILAEGIQCGISPTPNCNYAATHIHLDHMTQQEHDLILSYLVDMQLRNYSFSNTELNWLISTARRVRAVGSRLAFVVLPINGIAELNPAAYLEFLDRTRPVATRFGAPFSDLHSAVDQSDWTLWTDPSHLDDKEARAFASELASVAAGAT